MVGLNQAKKLLLLGEPISAATALSLNLVTTVANDPLVHSKQLAERLAGMPARSLASIKRNLEMATFPHSEIVLSAEVDAASWCFADPIAVEAFKKFKGRKLQRYKKENSEYTSEDKIVKTSYSDGECNTTLVMLLVRAAQIHGPRPFLRFGKVDISYAQFAEDVAHLAGGLSQAGVQRGHIVGAMMLNSREMACAWFATMWIGGVWAPLNVSELIALMVTIQTILS